MLRSLVGLRFHDIPLYVRRLIQLYEDRGLNLNIGIGARINNSRIGKHVFIGSDVTLNNVTIGDRSYVNRGSTLINTTIGKYSSIGPNVQIIIGGHPVEMVSTHPAFYAANKPFRTYAEQTYYRESGKAEIGNDVWIGEGVLIPSDASIGNGAIVASRAVVAGDVEPYSIVGGVPARLIRYRFNEKIRNAIATSCWWEWDDAELQRCFSVFHDPDSFLEYLSERDSIRLETTTKGAFG